AVDATSKDIRRYRARAHAAGTLTPEVERMLDDLQRDPHQRIVQELFAPRRTDPSSCPAVGAALTILGRLPRGGLWPGGTTKLWGTGHSGLLLVGVGVGVGVATLLEGAVHLDAVEGWTVSRGCALTTYVGASWFAGDDGWPAFVVAIGLAVVTVAAYLGVRHEPLDGLIPDRGPAHAGRRRDRHGDPDDRCRHDGDLRGRGAGRTGGDGPGGGAFRSAASVVRSPMEENGLRAWWRNRRQRRYPPEFRIARPIWPDGVQRDYERVATALATLADRPAEPSDDGALAEAALGLWRAQRRFESEDPAGTSQLTRQLRRHVETAWKGLANAGITVHEHDDEPHDDGLALEVVAREPRPGLSRDTVVQTVSPSILRSGKVIRTGEVVVGYPVEDK
ncbi:MAG TPA: hypothetical protein VKZ81_32375, partial [Pseudonocardia sp.]|nr:hypothetical protein [Pseudonocardia sp.]